MDIEGTTDYSVSRAVFAQISFGAIMVKPGATFLAINDHRDPTEEQAQQAVSECGSRLHFQADHCANYSSL